MSSDLHNLLNLVKIKYVHTLDHIKALIYSIDRNTFLESHSFLEHLLVHFEETHMCIDVFLTRLAMVVVEATIDGELGLRRVSPIERLLTVAGIAEEVHIELQFIHHHLHLSLRQLIGVLMQCTASGRARLVEEVLARLDDIAYSSLCDSSIQVLSAKDVAEHVLKHRLGRDQQIFETEEVDWNVGCPSFLQPVIIEPQPRGYRQLEPFVPPGPERWLQY